MGRYTKGIDHYKAQRARFARTTATARQMHEGLAVEGYHDWKELTAGTLTKEQTKGRYARRGGGRGRQRGRAALLPVNRPSGRLHKSITKRRVSANPQRFHVGPTRAAGRSLYVLLPGGTRKMVARGVQREVKRRWRPRNKALIDAVRARQRK